MYMKLLESFAKLRSELLQDILTSDRTESDRTPLTRVGEIVKSGGKVSITNKSVGRCTRNV